GTHVGGRDIDIAYYQIGTPDNHMRPICPHAIAHQDQRRCVAPPTRLDARRTALFIGTLFESPRVRIVGVDGAAAPVLQAALRDLCRDGLVAPGACAMVRLGFETEDTGRGWYAGHENHIHVSWR